MEDNKCCLVSLDDWRVISECITTETLMTRDMGSDRYDKLYHLKIFIDGMIYERMQILGGQEGVEKVERIFRQKPKPLPTRKVKEGEQPERPKY